MKDKNEVHYFEVFDLVAQFISAFDSIVIGRFTNKTLEGKIPVRFTYAPKQAVLHSISNKAEHMTVPVISVSISGISRDRERVQSKNVGHYINNTGDSNHVPAPVPVNISIDMSIITRYQTDMDQILANFIPYANPYIILSWTQPTEFSATETELRSEVLWSEDISLTQPLDRGDGDRYRNIADTSFIIKGWLFKRHEDNAIGNIFEIDADFYPIKTYEDIFSDDLEQVDEWHIDAYPAFTFQQDTQFVQGTAPIYKQEGNNFDYTDDIYVSTDTPSIFTEPMVDYGDFTAIKLNPEDYDIVSDNVVYVNIPMLNDVGNVTVIVENRAGHAETGEIPVVTL
jgi:hypothetical protein